MLAYIPYQSDETGSALSSALLGFIDDQHLESYRAVLMSMMARTDALFSDEVMNVN
jgi:hypothetical protein